jgi:hypothetical protein
LGRAQLALGGRTAVDLTLTHPDRVTGLAPSAFKTDGRLAFRMLRYRSRRSHQQEHGDHAEHVPLQRRVAVGRRAQEHKRHATEREDREHERTRVDARHEPSPAGR